MRSDSKRTCYFQADASALGGFIEKPFAKVIPAQASATLPPVGGYATMRSEHFNFEEIVSCRAAYTRVSGSEQRGSEQRGSEPSKDGPFSTLVTSVVEGLKILEVVTAERVVAQISVDYPRYGDLPRFSLAGSHFEGLRIAGVEAQPALNFGLLQPKRGADASQATLTWPTFQQTGREQAERLFGCMGDDDREGFQWLAERLGWMTSKQQAREDLALCSLVNGLDAAIPGRAFGHVVEIPDFGRIFLGELLVTPSSLRLSMIRAELGCAVTGQTTAGYGGVGGHMVPP